MKSSTPWRWYLKAQSGVLLLPVGLCLFGEAVSRRVVQLMGGQAGEWFWTGTLSLICINAGIGLMIDSGLSKGFPRRESRGWSGRRHGVESRGTVPLRCFQGVDLPTGTIGAGFEHTIEIIRSMLRRRIRANMTRTQAILNGQQIHPSPPFTTTIVRVSSMVVDWRKPVCSLRTD